MDTLGKPSRRVYLDEFPRQHVDVEEGAGSLEDMNTLLRIVATAIAAGAAVWLIPGLELTGEGLASQAMTLLLVAVVIGLVNAIVRPFVTAMSACLVLLTLGLFLLVINALMLELVGWISGQVGIGFHVAGFWPALWGSIVISIVSALSSSLLGVDKKR